MEDRDDAVDAALHLGLARGVVGDLVVVVESEQRLQVTIEDPLTGVERVDQVPAAVALRDREAAAARRAAESDQRLAGLGLEAGVGGALEGPRVELDAGRLRHA